MNLAIPTLAVTCVPFYASLTPYGQAMRFEVGTAASIKIESRELQPTMTFAVSAEKISSHETTLDWMSLSSEVLPDARPMTPDERSSINEFFWSHF
jgi:hypothetical protein